MKAFLYHIEDPEHPGNTEFGYIGVTRTPQRRFREHSASSYLVGQKIRSLNLTNESMKILIEGDLDECYAREAELRPNCYIGWNITVGGGGPPEFEQYTKERRSKIQKLRMANTLLREIQGENFRVNYFSNTSAIELRKRRAKEHMSDPAKKQACLSAMHKRIKCPHCAYESNAGNVAQHVRKHHGDPR